MLAGDGPATRATGSGTEGRNMNEIEARLTALEGQLARLLADNADLRADNDGLRLTTGRLEADNAALLAQIGALCATTAMNSACEEPPARRSPDHAEHDGEVHPRPVSRRGMIAAVAGAAGGALLATATPAAAANGQPMLLGQANTATTTTAVTAYAVNALQGTSGFGVGRGVYGWATAPYGQSSGVMGESNSNFGTGVTAVATHDTGSTYGLYARADSNSGIGVYGQNSGSTGIGTGYAVYASGRLKALGRSYLGAPATAPIDTDLNSGSISFYLDQTNNKLKVRVKYSNGTLKTATVGLL